MLKALSNTSVDLDLKDRWVIDVGVYDDDGCWVSDAVTVTVTSTPPSGSATTPTVERQTSGLYRAAVTVALAGRYVAVASATGYGSVSFAAYVTGTTTGANFPDLDDVKAYLAEGDTPSSINDDVLTDALDAESAAQRRKCVVPAVYPPDLKQALMRRVARNLALRAMPLAVPRGDSEIGSMMPPGRDPEVRRLEAPWRKLVQP